MPRHHYFLKDLDDPDCRIWKRITLKDMERDRNNTDPPVKYRIRTHEDVLAADMPLFYAEANYELIIKEV